MSQFSSKLRYAIEESGVPIETLARRGGISASMLYKIQSGSRLPDSTDTLEKLLEAMACALPQKKELLQDYQIERIGVSRYASFQALKGMLSDIATRSYALSRKRVEGSEPLPGAIIGAGNVNLAVQTLLGQEALRPGGHIEMMVPLRYDFCLDCLSVVLADCNPEFVGVRHLFCMKATGTGEAILYNMEAIRQLLPRMLNMERYDPWYCYLPDPDDGTALFPYFISTEGGVLMLDGNLQSAIFLEDPEVCNIFRLSFDRLAARFRPVMHAASGDFRTYLMLFRQIISGLDEYPAPVTMAAEPCVLPCLRPEIAVKYLPAELLEDPETRPVLDMFFQGAAEHGHTSFFTMAGLERLIKTGVIMELRGRDIPQFRREDILDALEEMIRRAKQGTITLCLFRQDVFQGDSRFSMGLYDTKLFTGCEVPARNVVFSDISEGTLARVLREYADNALLLGDVYPPEESLRHVERMVRDARAGRI